MYFFEKTNFLTRYATVNDILQSFYKVRLSYYDKRKLYQIEEMKQDIAKMQTKMKFLELIVSKKLVVANVPPDQIKSQMDVLMPELNSNYSELLSMPIGRLTQEELTKFKKKIEETTNACRQLELMDSKQLWNDELNELEKRIIDFNRVYLEEKLVSQDFSQKAKGKDKKVVDSKQKKPRVKKI